MSVAASVRDSASILPSLWKRQVAMSEAIRALQTWAPHTKGLKLAPVPGLSCARLGILLFLVLISLPSLYGDLGSLHHSSYEIVIPKSLTVEGREDQVEKLSYVLFMQGQRQLIHLTVKRDYFVDNFPVFSYHNGILGQEMPPVSQDCHYEGYIEGVPGSFVSVNTCSGLRGLLIKEEKSYGIEPVHSSKRFEHVLYAMAHEARVSCGVTSKDSQVASTSRRPESGKPHSWQVPSDLWSHIKYVEMVVVVNNQRFQLWGSDVKQTVQRVMDIIALANSFTRGINTEVVLAGMEIWTEGDLTEVPVDLQVALRNFNSWRQENLFHRVKHDVAHMIVGQHPKEDTGQAFLSGACSSDFAAAVESFHHEDVLLFAALMVHELGHNLGIRHDHSACICKDRPFCLMHENITKESGFSNCSSDFFHQFLWEHKGACLFNKPGHKGRLRRASRCGNGIVEEDEQCDCGTVCGLDQCCDDTCRLKSTALCNPGPCCNATCQYERTGRSCRPASGECDLPEFCLGTSGECPPDTYKQDGSVCMGGYYCVKGVCMSSDAQCSEIFGFPAKAASEECFRSFNGKGNRFGNCGTPIEGDSSYIKCENDAVFCGKMICTNVQELPETEVNYTLLQTHYKNDFCWSMDKYSVTDVPDSGDAKMGIICAPGKVCIDFTCSDVSVLGYDCDVKVQCNQKGVCNNNKNCHCDDGFSPPDCKNPGPGGSVDSGFPGPDSEGGGQGSTTSDEDGAKHVLGTIIPLVAILCMLLLLLIICCICVFHKADKGAAAKPKEEPAVPEAKPPEEKPPEEEAEEEEEEEEEEKEEEEEEESEP
ncbi:disintegrin and metalloproteinase domain-containing protein 1a-like [Ovis canadensis]|uniref:disintegrin and metalloproteinase domain-containing protein 1a-like n=1 Tax=Ovis canadensis TaxID=37174 RepID=UPI003750CBC5